MALRAVVHVPLLDERLWQRGGGAAAGGARVRRLGLAWPRACHYIVACVPSFVDGGSSESVAAGKGTACVGSVGTLGHIDADEVGSGAH